MESTGIYTIYHGLFLGDVFFCRVYKGEFAWVTWGYGPELI
jgi:hypothetical protein